MKLSKLGACWAGISDLQLKLAAGCPLQLTSGRELAQLEGLKRLGIAGDDMRPPGPPPARLHGLGAEVACLLWLCCCRRL